MSIRDLSSKKVDISVNFCGLDFENPFLLSSGPPTKTTEMIGRAFEMGWAGAVTKALGSQSRPNPSPRIAAVYSSGKAIGLQNIESVIYPLRDWLPRIRFLKSKYPKKILIANLMGGTSVEDWQEMTELAQGSGFDMIELNLSCPLTEEQRTLGATLGQNPTLTREIVAGVKQVAVVPIMVKLSPNVTDLIGMARAAESAGADAISAINTVLAFGGVDIETMEPKPSVGGTSAFGGYSGPAIKPIALRCIAQIAANSRLPVSGIGGISTWEDAVEFFVVGASTVQLCTAVILRGYRIINSLTEGVSKYLVGKGFDTLENLVGCVLPKLTAIEKLDFEWRIVPRLEISACTKCGICYVICSDAGYEAIRLNEENIPIIDQKKCDGCGVCIQLCPARALVSSRSKLK